MLSRSKIRNVCNNMKRGVCSDEEIVTLVEGKLPPEFSWLEFADKWDVVILDGSIEIIETVKDEKVLFETCAQKKFAVLNGAVGKWKPQQKFIIDRVESIWLEPIMNWENYSEVWEVFLNKETNKIETKLLNIPLGQREISQEELIPVETEAFFSQEIPVAYVDLSNTVPLTDAIKQSLKDKGLLP